MAGLLNSIRDQLEKGNTEGSAEAQDNINKTIQLASRKLLSQVENNEQELDVKDIKDLAAVSSLLAQTNGNDDGATGTPQAPSQMAGAFQDEVPIEKTPDDTKEVDQKDLLDLSSEDVDKMVKKQFKTQNGINYKKNQA